jgi:hypothetical protein
MKQCDKNDAKWLTALMLDADVFGACSEDGTERGKMAAYVKNLLARPDIVVVAPVPGKMIHTFNRQNGVLYDIHTAIRKNSGLSGREKINLTREACIWMIKTKGARKFITHVPEGNRAAGIYAVACGLHRVGVMTKSMKKNGALLDVTIYQSNDEEIQNIIKGEL